MGGAAETNSVNFGEFIPENYYSKIQRMWREKRIDSYVL